MSDEHLSQARIRNRDVSAHLRAPTSAATLVPSIRQYERDVDDRLNDINVSASLGVSMHDIKIWWILLSRELFKLMLSD